MNSPVIRVVLADDQRLFIDSLKTVIENTVENIQVVGVAYNGYEAIECVRNQRPDIVLLDVRMPDLDGVKAAKEIGDKYPETKIVMLTTFDDDEYVQEALKYKAVGYILKDIPLTELISVLPAIHDGTFMISQKVASRLLAQVNQIAGPVGPGHGGREDALPDWFDELTAREREVLVCIAEGLDNREIAEKLFIAEQTVKNHISVIYSKLGVHKRLQAMRLGKSIL
jgi:DNA-binding NarL/FixJ family response regulator